ncbi:MAG: hemerythrin domain-containing protein [Methylococcales bacterium]|nr:hemerythrin domain-containing protein [Methylococcales bacterium]
MKFQFTDPATHFSDGLAVIKIYHQTLLEKGEVLLALMDDMKDQTMNKSLANRCIDLHCFYFHANRLHHLDEEEALFPLLKNHSEFYDGMMDLLTQDHEEIEYEWQVLAENLGNPEQISDYSALQKNALEFERKQREHLNREEEDFLPRVADLLSSAEKEQAGKKMAALRHLG